MSQITDELQLYREVSSMTGEIIYKYTIANDVMEMFKSNNVKSSSGTVITDYTKMLKERTGEDWEHSNVGTFIESLIGGGMGFFQQDIRVKIDSFEESWYHVVGKTLYDDNNNPEAIIGKFSQLEQNTYKYHNDSIDRLTGVLKSYEFKKQFQAKSQECAGLIGGFMVVSVSDVLKATGAEAEFIMDNAYVNISGRLKELFSYNALVGRMKEDEFVVAYYGNNITTEFLSKVEEFKEDIKDLELMGVKDYPIGICGGVYCGPLENENSYQVFDKASMAMAFSRYRSHNTIAMYSKDIEETFYTYSSENRRMKNAEIKLEHKLVQNTLKVLSESGDFAKSILEMFQTVGEEFGLDKISLYEMDSTKDNMISSFSWEKEVASINDNIAMSINEDVINWLLSNDEMAVIQDANKIDDEEVLAEAINGRTRAFVLAGYECGTVKGCICFEKYNERHKWSATEINIFELMNKLMSSCLVNIRLYNEMMNEATNRNRIDVLTGLYKYNVFLEEANKYISLHQNDQLAIICVKLDGFIRVNQCYGYEAGDQVLRDYAKVFINNKDRFVMGCRLNADNLIFLVNLFDDRGRMMSEATVEVIYSDFIEEMSSKYPASPLTTKAGVCRVDGNGKGIAEYVESADRIKMR